MSARSSRVKALIKTHARQKAHLGADDPRIARAIFTLRETAAYLDLPKSTVQWWARPPESDRSLITCFPARGKSATVPFIGFAEAFVLSSFSRAGVPLQRIRPAVEVLTKEIGVEHALASKRLYTDGAEVLFDYANRRGEREVGDLVVVRTQQRQFAGVVKDYLKRIHYGGDGWADSCAAAGLRATPRWSSTRRSPSASRWSSTAALESRISSTAFRPATPFDEIADGLQRPARRGRGRDPARNPDGGLSRAARTPRR